MTNQTFKQAIRGVFAAHGKIPPTGLVLEVIWERIEELPDQFMIWAGAELRDVEKLPGNLGYHIASVLWPLWRRNNPSLRAREQFNCSDCSGLHDLPGSGFYCFKQYDDGWHGFISPCRCASLPKGYRLNVMTKAQAAAAGYRLIPDDWEHSAAAFERWLKFQEMPGEKRKVGEFVRALEKAGQIDPFAHDPRRFRHMTEAERAEAL